MLRKISIRVRLTIYIIVLLTCVCVLLTGLSIYNANQSFVVPFLVSEVDGEGTFRGGAAAGCGRRAGARYCISGGRCAWAGRAWDDYYHTEEKGF